MALFKISKGLAANLPSKKTEGWCYFTTDDGKFYVDISDTARQVLNANHADTASVAENANLATRALNADNATNAINAENADTADKLTTARTISLTGDVTGSTSFNGSKNVSITAELSNTGVTAGTYGPGDSSELSASALAFGGAFRVPSVTVDEDGRVTAAETKAYTLPNNVDTKNTAGSTNSNSKLFLIGATTQGTNPKTYSHDTAYVGADGHLYSNSKKVLTGLSEDTDATGNLSYGGNFEAITGLTVDGENIKVQTTKFTVPNVIDTNTAHTHSAGEGLEVTGAGGTTGDVSYALAESGVTAGTYGTNQSPGYGTAFTIPKITVDKYGRVTGVDSASITLPNSDNVDTKVTQTARTTNGEFPVLLRGTSAGTSTITNTTTFGAGITVNPSAKTVTATAFKGALYGNANTATRANSAALADEATTATTAGFANFAKNGIHYIEGTGSATSVWAGSHEKITEYYPGLTIAFKTDATGQSSTDTTLNINGLGAVKVVRNVNSQTTTHYGVGSILLLVYTVDDTTPYWKIADYDANNYAYVRQYHTVTDATYPMLFGYDATLTNTASYVTKYTRKSNNLYVNPNTGTIFANTFSGTATNAAYAVSASTANSANYATQANKANYATKLGTTNVGDATKLWYLNAGAPTQSTANRGSSTLPVYLANGVITNCSNSLAVNITGTAAKANQATSATTATKLGSATIGGDTKLWYLNAGTPTNSAGNAGSNVQPVYLVNGVITASTGAAGSSTKPVYLNNGIITECGTSLDVNITGTAANATYATSAGTANSANYATKLGTVDIGGTAKPIWIDNGTAKAISANVGSTTVPVYLKAGTITQCSTTLGVNITGNAAYATNAGYASTTANATYATSAGTADTADTATTANSATYASKLGTANLAAGNKLWYLVNGTPTLSVANHGSATKPVYLNNGVITNCGSSLDVNISGQAATAANATYAASAGTATSASSATNANYANYAGKIGTVDIGSEAKPVWVDNGVVKAISVTRGSATKPVYINAGVITNCGSSLDVNITGQAATAANATYATSAGTAVNANYSNYAGSATKATQDSQGNQINVTYVKRAGDTMTGVLNAFGGIALNGSTASTNSMQYVLGIKAFADGGNVQWSTTSNLKVGYATSAGSATSATTAATATNAHNDGAGANIITTYETKANAATVLQSAKNYTNSVKDSLLNGAGAAYDTLKELGDLITNNRNALDALNIVASGKQDKINVTASRALVSDTAGAVAASNVTATELSYLSGAASNIQSQIYTARNVVRYLSNTSDTNFPILFANNASLTSGNRYMVKYVSGITINPNTKTITAAKFDGLATSATTAVTANKLGTDAGTNRTLVYFSGGIPVASTNTTGSSTKPVYLNAGVITECSGTLAVNISGNAAYATNAGYATNANHANYADQATNATYAITATNANHANYADKIGTVDIGNANKPVWIDNGVVKTISGTVGSSTRPVYLNAGTITQCGTSLAVNITGSANKATYDSSGKNIASTYLPLSGGIMTGHITHQSYSKTGHMTATAGAFAVQGIGAETQIHLASQSNTSVYAAMVFKESEKCIEFQFT